ncbi:adhesion G protein-coupled receptor E1 [Pteronotus mesoamericanus]|uniref:adhesion G protein-coupled receptor E1 n=1 Tax=Pteronotus mesoamericanus TaxID=1884717 RepID=UPI0023EABC3B|nr:adhesion G protein-coupled receptor E1 [Pteronotus parnellii mesoamericanus]
MWTFSLLLFCGWQHYSTQANLDVNECADTTTRPAYATCTNTVESYYCTCKRGFLSSNGLTRFRGPGVECKDVDECSLRPSPCGPNSVCKNLPGRYKCSCLPGFSSPTGDNWVPAKPGHFSCADINECLSGVCPEHSECTNSLGSYSCHCQDGFISNNSRCEEVDECTDPRACPEHATCHNSFGSYSCICNPGFESSSGNMSFHAPGVTCEDVDECSRNSTLCGLSTICNNIPGEYSCSCLPGFILLDFWIPKQPEALKCTDIDECPDMCPFNSTCTNTLGSYFCTCHPGFAPSNGQLIFTEQEVECRDIDECIQDPSLYGPNSVCTNALGSYSCGCIVGFRPHPEGSWKYGNFSCKRVPFKCKEDVIPNNKQVMLCQFGAAVEPEYVSFCALMNATFSVLDETCANKTTVPSLKLSTAESFASVLEQTSAWSSFTKDEISTLATVLLESVENTTLAALLKSSANGSQTVQTEHLEIESKVIKNECAEENVAFNLKAKGNEMKIGCSTIEDAESTGTTGVAFISFVGMESVLNESFFQDPLTPNSKRKLKMNSHVIGGIMTGEKKDGFSEPVIYALENIEPKQKFALQRPICVSWSTDVAGGRWTSSGCEVLGASEMHTVCSCNRMANLAMIMASGELTMVFSLYVISYVGTVISLVCLILAIATFLLCRAIRDHNTYLHLHLCVCLLLAKILFLAGVDKADNQTGCSIIAGLLHYLFLACFFWMLVEATMLFLTVRNLKVVNYFSSRKVKMLYLCAFGYGLPAPVVVVSVSVQPQGYGTHTCCWLNIETGFIWSFLGPVCAIIMINSVLLTWTLCILRQKLSSVNAEVSTLKNTRLLTFKAFAPLFILGCSWVLGIFQVGPMASVMAYLFTVVNSLQGAFIFLIHCLLNRQVREEYRRWITRKTKPRSPSQTSGILLSSIPFASRMVRDCVFDAGSDGMERLLLSNTRHCCLVAPTVS